MSSYTKPDSLNEVLEQLQSGSAILLAGGTDLYADEAFKADNLHLIDISSLSSLKTIERQLDGWWIGASVSWTKIVKTDLPPLFNGLKRAASMIGGRQIQNAGTIGGNICNASPAADSVPALLALDASVEIKNTNSSRMMKLDEFIIGRRKTTLQPNEMVTRVFIPDDGSAARSGFLKTGARAQLVISPIMVGGVLLADSLGVINSCRIVVGACSEVAQPLNDFNDRIVGLNLNEDLRLHLKDKDFATLNPISDMRADAAYRIDAAKSMTRRLVQKLQVSDD